MAQVTLTLSFNTVEEAQAFLSRSTPQCGDTAVNQAATIRVDDRSPFEKLMDELEDPRFKLRTFTELYQQTGIGSRGEIERMLRGNGVEYVVKTRSSDRAVMLGLAERN